MPPPRTRILPHSLPLPPPVARAGEASAAPDAHTDHIVAAFCFCSQAGFGSQSGRDGGREIGGKSDRGGGGGRGGEGGRGGGRGRGRGRGGDRGGRGGDRKERVENKFVDYLYAHNVPRVMEELVNEMLVRYCNPARPQTRTARMH